MKNITTFLLGVFLAVTACVLAQSTTPTPTEKKVWEITQLDMEEFLGNSPLLRQERVDYWKEKGSAQYDEAKKKLLNDGWEPFSVSLRGEGRTFSDSTIIFFRRFR